MSRCPLHEIFKAYDIRGLYGEQIDGDVAERIGARSRACSAQLAGKPVSELRVGLGRDMRLSAPELAARYREGLLSEGAHVIDAGQVGSEMLYFLVGSRELDGGLMCTASHNPKAYTGAKLVREGAIALSGDSGIQDIRREVEADERARRRRRRRRRRARDASRRSTSTRSSRRRRCASSTPTRSARATPRPLKVVLDGGNGMAGPMVGPLLERLGPRADRDLLDARRQLPRPRAQPAAAREPRVHHREGARERRRPRHRLGRRRGPLLLHRRHGRVRRRRLPDGAAGGVAAAQEHPARRSSTTCAPRARSPTRSRAAGGTPYVNRVGHAFFKTRMRKEGSLFGGEVSGHYYFRDFYCADSGTIPALLVLELLAGEGKTPVGAARRLPRALLHLRRDQLRGRRPAGEDGGDRRALRRRPPGPARRDLDRLRGLALQRAPLQHRAAAAPVPGVARLARGHGAPPRRGARADPLARERLLAARGERDGQRRTRRPRPSARPGAGGRGGHPPPGDPDAVHGRARQRVPDRGLAADAGRLGPELGQGAGRARAGARCARPPRSRTSSCW